MKDKSTQFPEVKGLMQVINQPLLMFVSIAPEPPQDVNYYYYYYPRPRITITENQPQAVPYFKTIKK